VGLHSCLSLSWADRPVPAARLAAYFDLAAPYLNKQLQARAGVPLRRELAGTTIADLRDGVHRQYPGSDERTRDWLAQARA
jgi:hypothetical protein